MPNLERLYCSSVWRESGSYKWSQLGFFFQATRQFRLCTYKQLDCSGNFEAICLVQLLKKFCLLKCNIEYKNGNRYLSKTSLHAVTVVTVQVHVTHELVWQISQAVSFNLNNNNTM